MPYYEILGILFLVVVIVVVIRHNNRTGAEYRRPSLSDAIIHKVSPPY